MGKHCAAIGCTNTSKKLKNKILKEGVTFHGFPLKHPEVLAKWIERIKRDGFVPTRYSFLCSDHFNDDDFDYQPFTGMRMIKKGAVPSKFFFTPGCTRRKRFSFDFGAFTNVSAPTDNDDDSNAPLEGIIGQEIPKGKEGFYTFEEVEEIEDFTVPSSRDQLDPTPAIKCEMLCDSETCQEEKQKLNQDLCQALLTLMQLKEKIKVLQIMAERTEKDLSARGDKVGKTELDNIFGLVRYILDQLEVDISSEKGSEPSPVNQTDDRGEVRNIHRLSASNQTSMKSVIGFSEQPSVSYKNRKIQPETTSQLPSSTKFVEFKESSHLNPAIEKLPYTDSSKMGDGLASCQSSLFSNTTQKPKQTAGGTTSSKKIDNGNECFVRPEISKSSSSTDSDDNSPPLQIDIEEDCDCIGHCSNGKMCKELRCVQKKEKMLKKVMCELCGKLFRTSTAHTIHVRSCHTGERPFECIICGMKCLTPGLLNGHMRNHSNQRSHQCSLCPKAFKLAKTLKKHQATHSEERPYVCLICNKGFKHKGSWTLHKKQFHSD